MHLFDITILLILLLINVNFSLSTNCSDTNIQRLCLDQETCDECLQTDSCCNWCYDVNYGGRKCNILSNLIECNKQQIEVNSESGSEIPDHGNKDFTDGNAKEIVQIKPQFFNIKLGKGQSLEIRDNLNPTVQGIINVPGVRTVEKFKHVLSRNSDYVKVCSVKSAYVINRQQTANKILHVPVNFTFTYKPAKNYPLELYYLGDLSVSMREHLSIFKTLGTDLPNNLTELTRNYRLAYGSFLDKTAMPFYFTAPDNFDNPCLNLLLNDCETGYLFRHRLNFTKDVDRFAEKISSSKITANVDDLDGALDAILQILICGEKMGWTVISRKIILLPTDSLLHTAGDGLLAGAVLMPNNTCLIDDEGNHTSPLLFDYPSVGQIATLLKEKKVNIIFAVKDKVKLEYYKNLTEELLGDSAFVGELEEDSKNILHLITKGFYNFARQVSFSINKTLAENVDVKFFSDCEGHGVLNETSVCYNIEENAVNFTVQLTLKGPPTKKRDMLFIEEKNINEKIALNITYLGLCDCKNYDGIVTNCINGEFRCGQCLCREGWTGEACDEDCDESDNFNSCRSYNNGIPSSICNRNGDCVCGRCRCDFPFSGKYCEYECPVNNGSICSGLTQGVCVEGVCECKEGFEGKDCSCSKFTNNCKLSESMDICSGNGDCVCNTCKCSNGFSGQYCEVNKKQNNTLCEDYKTFVEDAAANGTYSGTKDNSKVLVEEVDVEKRRDICGNITCQTVTYVGNSLCSIDFCYYPGKDAAIHLLMTTSCYMTAGFRALTTGLIAFATIVLGGLVAIACMKYRLYRLEQAEYKKFENARKNLNELNPIYKDPVTTYRNPMRRKND